MYDYRVIACAATFTAVIYYYAARCLQVGRRPRDYPPGPPTLPVLGNLHLASGSDLGLLRQSLISTTRFLKRSLTSSSPGGLRNTGAPRLLILAPAFTDQSRPIYSLLLGTRTYVVLSSTIAVKDLLDKRSNIYSSRPDMYVGQDVASGGLRLVTMVIISVT